MSLPRLSLQPARIFGTLEEVESYALSTQVQLQWISSGDHSFKPTKSLGLSEARNWATAVDHFDGFLRQHLNLEIHLRDGRCGGGDLGLRAACQRCWGCDGKPRAGNGGGGIRTRGGFHLAGFQDRSHQPLDHLSSGRPKGPPKVSHDHSP